MNKKQSVRDRAFLAVALEPAAPAVVKTDAPKTAPGALLGFMQKESAVSRENEALRHEIQAWEGAVPVRALDPSLVVAGPWANRHEDSFHSLEFAALKKEIEEAGKNVQPIKVRPLPGSTPQKYEVVFGHRRHRACLELGVPVWAFIESLDDATTFVEMERENRQRANLSAYEQGLMYVRGMQLFSSMRKLGERIHRDVSDISKAVALANLPIEIVSAFPSPNDLQFRWAKPLSDAVGRAPDVVLKLAKDLAIRRTRGEAISAQQVFELLTAKPVAEKQSESQHAILVGSQVVGMITASGGRVSVSFNKGAVPASKIPELQEALAKLLG